MFGGGVAFGPTIFDVAVYMLFLALRARSSVALGLGREVRRRFPSGRLRSPVGLGNYLTKFESPRIHLTGQNTERLMEEKVEKIALTFEENRICRKHFWKEKHLVAPPFLVSLLDISTVKSAERNDAQQVGGGAGKFGVET